MKVPGMLDNIKAKFTESLADYVPVPAVDDYLVLPGLADDAHDITGAIILANEVKA